MKILDLARLIQTKVTGCELMFLGQLPENDVDGLLKDRKIQDGVDKRTYQVIFDRVEEILPNFKSNVDIENGVERLLSELEHWRLNLTKFKQRDFYRLQQLEHLYQTRQIDDYLYWKR